ncbi:MAG: ABC transporter substrate-binding protein [Sagittula sp.]|uniref:ABC transporter substrate-binding protein n=1 Tax=Sagittula sp. TaxID=2038081 RepID=UPI004058417A
MTFRLTFAAIAAVAFAASAQAEGTYDTGASDDEILIGITAPLSGPASSYGIACAAHAAYFEMINEKGGVNDRKLKLLCEDDGFSPPRAIEQTRKLVESDGVLFMYNSLGTSTNTAVAPYLTSMEVPQLLLNSGASKWNDPAQNPWQTSSIPHYLTEAQIFAQHIMETMPDAKVALLQQADDYGKDYLEGLKLGFGDKFDQYVTVHETFELSDPTVDSQMLTIANSKADIVVLAALAKHAAQGIRKLGEIEGYAPQIYLGWSSTGIDTVLKPAGLEHAKGIISTAVIKHPEDPAWAGDPGVAGYVAFMNEYFPDGVQANISNVFAYATNEVLIDLLERAGDNLTRENIRDLAQTIDVQPSMYIDGVKFTTSPDDLDPIKTFQMIQFDGEKWVQIGEPITAD